MRGSHRAQGALHLLTQKQDGFGLDHNREVRPNSLLRGNTKITYIQIHSLKIMNSGLRVNKQNSHPLITKYELYLNSSTPKSPSQHKTSISDSSFREDHCGSKVYRWVLLYFDYISWEGKYGFARHALMSKTGQRHPEGKEAGKFEKAMVIENIERNKKPQNFSIRGTTLFSLN